MPVMASFFAFLASSSYALVPVNFLVPIEDAFPLVTEFSPLPGQVNMIDRFFGEISSLHVKNNTRSSNPPELRSVDVMLRERNRLPPGSDEQQTLT